MTLPNNLPPSPAIPFAVTGIGSTTDGSGTTPADLASRTQAAITALLQAEVQGSPGWNSATASVWAGLRRGTPGNPVSLILAVVEAVVNNLFGTVTHFPALSDALTAIETVLSSGDFQSFRDAIANALGHTGGEPYATSDIQTFLGAIPTDLGSLVDNLTNSLIGTGAQFSSMTVAQARMSMDAIFGDVLTNTQNIQSLRSTSTGASVSGTSVTVDFSTYSVGSLPSIFTVTYSGLGTSTVGVNSAGNAAWTLVNDANRAATVIYNVAPTDTDYQIVRGVMASPPQGPAGGGTPRIWALGRVNSPSSPTTYVWARAYSAGLFGAYKADIGCTVAGVDTVFVSGIALGWSTDMYLIIGAGGTPRRYQLYSGTTLVYDYTEVGTTSQYGSGYRHWGAKSEMKTGLLFAVGPGQIAATSVSDNAPPIVQGCTFRVARHSTGTSTPSASSTPAKLPTGFFDTLDYCSPDMSWDGSSALTVGIEGTYASNMQLNMNYNVDVSPTLFANNVAKRVTGNGYTDGVGASGICLIYLKSGDVLNPGYQSPSGPQFIGDAAGISTFWEVALVNHSLT